MIGAAIINTLCYTNDLENVHVGFDEDSVSLGYRMEF